MKMSDVVLRLIGARDPHCPNEPEILGYLENTVSPGRRARFERHFTRCDDCRELLALLGGESDSQASLLTEEAVGEQTDRILAYIQRDGRSRNRPSQRARTRRGFSFSNPAFATIGVVVVAILVAGILIATRQQSSADAAMQALRLAVKDARYTQARVSGGLDYSRYSVTRGGDRKDDDLQFSRAMNKLTSAEQETAPAADRLVLARVYLSRGTREDARRALAILNQLAARGVETPEALNDAGVAQLQLGNYDDAIAYFSRALAKSPSYGEALFNRALTEGQAGRVEDARGDWQRFIEQSSDENWKLEAVMHMNSLRGAGDR